MTGGRYNQHKSAPFYEVIVGNVGTVYSGFDLVEADAHYEIYVGLSLSGHSRASDESVTLMEDGEIERHFVGALDVVNGWSEAGFSRIEARRHARFDTWDDYPPAFKRRLIELVDQSSW